MKINGPCWSLAPIQPIRPTYLSSNCESAIVVLVPHHASSSARVLTLFAPKPTQVATSGQMYAIKRQLLVTATRRTYLERVFRKLQLFWSKVPTPVPVTPPTASTACNLLLLAVKVVINVATPSWCQWQCRATHIKRKIVFLDCSLHGRVIYSTVIWYLTKNSYTICNSEEANECYLLSFSSSVILIKMRNFVN